jgi:hypothetical protein
MDKTLHKKLTKNRIYLHTSHPGYHEDAALFNGFSQEMTLLREAATDLLQPRPQAIASILKSARAI